nr:ABC transporter ATP-binding protein [Collinsella sp. AF31-11]
MILDEPFTGLDTAARDACAEVVLDLLDGRMMLFAMHDAAGAQALNISDIITL